MSNTLAERLAALNQRIEALDLLPYQVKDGHILLSPSLSSTIPFSSASLDTIERQLQAAEQHRAENEAREAARANPPPPPTPAAPPTMTELLAQFNV